jgi:hypothetical protein
LNLNCIEVEQRRRCWAGLKLLYMIQAMSFGNPVLLTLSKFNVKLPMDVNDIDIHPGSILTHSHEPTQMSYMLFKVHLYRLTSRISDQIFGSQRPSHANIAALDAEIEAEQDKWDAMYLRDIRNNRIQGYQRVHWNILHSHAHQLYLLIHRPFFDHNTEDSSLRQSRARCITSATALLDIHKLFFEERQFEQFKWYGSGLGSFHAFHGAVVLAMALLQDKDEESNYQMRAPFDEIITRFEILAGRSTICAKALPILKYLRYYSFNLSSFIQLLTF